MLGPASRFSTCIGTLSLACAICLCLASGSGAESASGSFQRAAKLRARTGALEARQHQALLDLYALETRLAAAQARLADLHAASDGTRARQAVARRQLSITRHALAVSQRRLATRLRMIYEQGEPDALTVVLGATSLDEAIANLDAVTRSADQSRSAIEQTTATRRSLDRLSRALDRQAARLAALEAQASRTAVRLAGARAERTSFIAELRTRTRLNRVAIRSLESTARAAQLKSQQLTAAREESDDGAAAPATPTAVPGAPAAPASGRTITVLATGYSLGGRTATGMPVGVGVAAVDPAVIPLGTRFTVPGYGEAVAADTGGAVRGNVIDLWFPTPAQARAWGGRTVTVALH